MRPGEVLITAWPGQDPSESRREPRVTVSFGLNMPPMCTDIPDEGLPARYDAEWPVRISGWWWIALDRRSCPPAYLTVFDPVAVAPDGREHPLGDKLVFFDSMFGYQVPDCWTSGDPLAPMGIPRL